MCGRDQFSAKQQARWAPITLQNSQPTNFGLGLGARGVPLMRPEAASASMSLHAADKNARKPSMSAFRATVVGSYMDESVGKQAHEKDHEHIYASFKEIEGQDVVRNEMINDARRANFAWVGFTGFMPHNIMHTTLPQIIQSPVLYMALVSFALFATLTRLGYIDHTRADYDDTAFAQADILVSLLMAFYLGYCYHRYYEIYFCCVNCRNAVFDCCALASVYLYDEVDVWRVWRYTNLAHVSTMVGISPVYTFENLFIPYVEETGLLQPADQREREKLVEAHMELTGMRAPQACLSWAMAVVSDARRARRLEKPEGVTLGDKIIGLRTALASLFHFQFQVCVCVCGGGFMLSLSLACAS